MSNESSSQGANSPRPEAPYCRAAFINAIAEEGTKAEAVQWLQKTWNELCEARAEIERLKMGKILEEQLADPARRLIPVYAAREAK